MSDDREQTNDGARPPLSFEKMEEILKSVVPDAEKVAMGNILNEIAEDFAAAEPTDKPTEEDIEAEARDRTFLELQQKCRHARIVFRVGIKLKRNEPDSELYKLAKEGLELVDQIEGGNVDKRGRLKTVTFLYMQSLQGESQEGETPQPEQVKAIPINEDQLKACAEGTWHDVTEGQLKIIEKLNENPGAWFSGRHLKANPLSEERPDKIIKLLPAPLRNRIESGRSGYRLV